MRGRRSPLVAVGLAGFPLWLTLVAGPVTAIEKLTQVSQGGNPNRDRFLQTPPVQPIPEPQPVPSVIPPAPQPSPTLNPQVPIAVRQIQVVGSTVFSAAELGKITEPFQGRSLTPAELGSVADQVTQLYLDQGYLTSRAVLVDQQITDGVVRIQVIEGSLEAIEIEGTRRTHPDYVRSRIALGGRTPLNQAALEDQLRLLRLDPLFENVEASVRAGSGLGLSILTVRVTEARPYNIRASVDNFSPPNVGSERLGVALFYRNLTEWGDEIAGSYYRSTTGGSNLYDLSYRIPVNPMNGTVELRAAPSTFTITDPAFARLDLQGNARLYELSFRQPLVRSPREEFALSAGFTYRSGETLINGLQIDSSTTSVFKFGQDYLRRDPGGAWVLRSQFNIGTELLGATRDRNPDGQFVSWLGQVQRIQILNPNNLLILQADLQLTPDALLPSQQFVIGGGLSVRGFRQNVRIGDNGLRFSAENRFAVLRNAAGDPSLQIAPFVDLGAVWNSDGPAIDQGFLAGIGLGVLWQPTPPVSLRLDLALPLVELSDRGENAQDNGICFSINYQF